MPEFQEVLDWVNKIRDLRGIGPALDAMPKGVRRSACECPLAYALNAEVTVTSAHWFGPGNGSEAIPFVPVGQFIVNFDLGSYPELIA